MGEVSSSHHGALGFILSMFSLQSFCFEAFFVYEPKIDSFKIALQHSQIVLLINNSIRFKSLMHVGFVSTSIHENFQCHNGTSRKPPLLQLHFQLLFNYKHS
jgi:hypothetical protein